MWRIVVVAGVWVGGVAPGAGVRGEAGCAVPVLWEMEGRLTLRVHEIPSGGIEVVGAGDRETPITAVLVLGDGLSGDLIRGGEERVIVLRCVSAGAQVSVRPLNGGEERTLPTAPADQLQRWDLRVSANRGTGESAVFRIRNGEVETDGGPAVDMFGGRVPMEPNDVAVTVEATPAAAGRGGGAPPPPSPAGSIEVIGLGPWPAVPVTLPDGSKAHFVVDLAATRTALSPTLLGPDADIATLEAVAFDGRSVHRSEGVTLGAGGSTEGARITRLPWLDVGDVRFPDVEALLLPDGLAADGRPVLGILGTDLLSRAGRVTGDFSVPEGGSPRRLTLGGDAADDWQAIPVTAVRGLLFVDIAAAGHRFRGLLDSGARYSLVRPEDAQTFGWPRRDASGDSVQGLDGTPIPVFPVQAPPLDLDGRPFPASPFMAGPVTVLEAVGLRETAVILGQPFFAHLGPIQIDFVERVLRIAP